MKAHNQQSSRRRWVMAPVLIGLALALMSCSGKGKNNSAISATGYLPGCPGCAIGANGNVVAAAIGSRQDSSQYLELGLRIHAETAGFPAWSYYGPVNASGYMTVQTGNWGGCSILPLGYYQIRNLGPSGSFAPDTSTQPWNLVNFDFEVVHTTGFVARVRVNYAEFYDQQLVVGADGGQYPHRMYGELIITPVTSAPSCYLGPVKLFLPRPF